ncbi:PglL family O-oligosaccharyltransferase [Roseateles toxinivorans]|nr:Wzy polymerase domain-containing protein [Roseateles toxinivorans]
MDTVFSSTAGGPANQGRSVKCASLAAFQWVVLILATVVPPMIVPSLLPAPAFLNELAAMAAWAAATLLIGISMRRRVLMLTGLEPALAGLALLLLGILSSWAFARYTLPSLIAGIGAVVAAGVMMLLGAAVRQGGGARSTLAALATGWVVLGIFSVAVAAMQVFFPESVGGYWLANSSEIGRAQGNIRQPNHLATFMIWSCISVVWLGEVGFVRRGLVLALLFGFVFTVVLSASRMGLLAVLLLCAWGLFDRKLSSGSRVSLLATGLMLALSWWLMSVWAASGEHVFGAANRVESGALNSVRFTLWPHAIELIKQHPLSGVGWHAFNLEWTFGAFTGRTNAYFSHVHNLPLQLVVELGVPIGLGITALLGWALLRAFGSAPDEPRGLAVDRRSAFMMVGMVVLHSMLEFPLWYLFFLLPSAFYLGFCLSMASARRFVTQLAMPGRAAVLAGGSLCALGVAMYADYMRVAVIYRPDEFDLPLIERIERAQSAWVFGPRADYALATNFPPGQVALNAAKRAARHYIDPQLMIVWATSLHATGDHERAAYIVKKLSEFPNPMAQKWLEPCKSPPLPGQEMPFQCAAGTKDFTIDEMLR